MSFISGLLLKLEYPCDKELCVPFTEEEMKALRLLLREEVQTEIRLFRRDVSQRFDEVATQLDGLYKRDEKREHEYLSIREQLRRLESRFG